MDALDLGLARLERRRRAQRALMAVARPLAVGLGLAALAVALVRLAAPEAAWAVPAAATAGLLLPLAWLPAGWRRRDPPTLLAGHLDRDCGAQGLAMAMAALPAGGRPADWRGRLAERLAGWRPHPLRWHPLRPAALALLALAAALALPQVEPPPIPPGQPPAPVQGLARRLTDLAEAGVIEPEVRAQLEEELKRLERHAAEQGLDPATWQALDRLGETLDQQAQAAARRLATAMAAAERAGAQGRAAGASDPAAAEALAHSLAELAEANPALLQLPDDPAARAALAALAAGRNLTDEQRAALKAAGLDPGQAAGAAGDARAMAEAAKALAGSLGEAAAQLKATGIDVPVPGEEGGRGGVSRGPGHAALAWDDPKRVEGGTHEGLPPGARLNADGSVTLAQVARDAPPPEQTAAMARAAARAFDPLAADARRAATNARHRAAVAGYFAATPTGSPGNRPPP